MDGDILASRGSKGLLSTNRNNLSQVTNVIVLQLWHLLINSDQGGTVSLNRNVV